MTKISDGNKAVEIEMIYRNEGETSWMPDWTEDFLDVGAWGNKAYDEDTECHICPFDTDVDCIIHSVQEWERFEDEGTLNEISDGYDRRSFEERCVTVREVDIPKEKLTEFRKIRANAEKAHSEKISKPKVNDKRSR